MLNFLPQEIINLINYHLNANKIQSIFKNNRPLTQLNIGDRVLINKKYYGTIIKIFNKECKIKLLPRLIPNWKICNINFWKSYENFLEINFPYYIPKLLKVNNNRIIKLNNWNSNENKINNKKRIEIYYKLKKEIQSNLKNKMFIYNF
jgi:hypothetical protein